MALHLNFWVAKKIPKGNPIKHEINNAVCEMLKLPEDLKTY